MLALLPRLIALAAVIAIGALRPFAAFLTFTLRALALVPFAVTGLIGLTIVRLALIAVAIIGPFTIAARLLLASLVVATLIMALILARFTTLASVLACVLGIGLIFTGLIFEIDIKARGNRIAAKNFGGCAVRLNRPQDSEIMLSVLQIVLGQNSVAGRRGVTRQLLVLLEHVLSMAADLNAVGAIRLKCAIGILRRLTAAIAALVPPRSTTAALPFHSFEISHAFVR